MKAQGEPVSIDSCQEWFPILCSISYVLYTLSRIYSFFSQSYQERILPNTEKEKDKPLRSLEIKPNPYLHYLTAPPLLITAFSYLNLVRKRLNILRRGFPTFFIVTKYNEAEKARWEEWGTTNFEKVENLHDVEETLWASAKWDIGFFGVAAFLCFIVVADSLRAGKEADAIVKSEEGLGGLEKGGAWDRAVRVWQKRWTSRCFAVALAAQLGLYAVLLGDVGKLEKAFWDFLDDVVGSWPKVDIEWKALYEGF